MQDDVELFEPVTCLVEVLRCARCTGLEQTASGNLLPPAPDRRLRTREALSTIGSAKTQFNQSDFMALIHRRNFLAAGSAALLAGVGHGLVNAQAPAQKPAARSG